MLRRVSRDFDEMSEPTLSPMRHRLLDSETLTTVPASSRPEMYGNSGIPKPKSLQQSLDKFSCLSADESILRCFPVNGVQANGGSLDKDLMLLPQRRDLMVGDKIVWLLAIA